MVNDLLVEILGQTYVPTFTYQLTLTGVVSDYRIEPGDQESLLAKITNLSQIEPGFDFDISPRRTITLYVPKKGSVKDFIFEHSLNCMISPYKNDGPKATHMLGMGQSTSAKFGFAKDSNNIATYRRRDITQEYQGVHKRKQVKAKVNSDIKRLSAPQKQFTVKWLGDTYELLSNVQVGDTVPVVG